MITSSDFASMYRKESCDLVLTPLTDGNVGFTLVREYGPQTEYRKSGVKMFILIDLFDEQYITGRVDMVREREEDPATYSFVSGDEYRRRVTSFYFSKEDGIKFNIETKKVILTKSKKQKSFNLNEFVDILVKNHLGDRLRLQRVAQFFSRKTLRFVFWLADRHYEEVWSIIRPKNAQEDYKGKRGSPIEPFFHYFNISKNILFAAMFCGILFSGIAMLRGVSFTILNPLIPLIAFFSLFVLEKISQKIVRGIEAFLNEDRNSFVQKLYDRQWRSNFKIRY